MARRARKTRRSSGKKRGVAKMSKAQRKANTRKACAKMSGAKRKKMAGLCKWARS